MLTNDQKRALIDLAKATAQLIAQLPRFALEAIGAREVVTRVLG